jgi:hypothetical protein
MNSGKQLILGVRIPLRHEVLLELAGAHTDLTLIGYTTSESYLKTTSYTAVTCSETSNQNPGLNRPIYG